MKDLILKTEAFTVGSQSALAARTFVSRMEESSIFGGVLMVLAVGREDGGREFSLILERVKSELAPRQAPREGEVAPSVEDRFVDAIARVNEGYRPRARGTREGERTEPQTATPPSSLLVAFIAGEHLSLAIRGDIAAYLVRPRHTRLPARQGTPLNPRTGQGAADQTTLPAGRQGIITSILERAQGPLEGRGLLAAPWGEKLFQEVITGHLDEEDTLLITTPNVLNYVSLERLKRLTLTLPLFTCREELEAQLLKARKETFGIIMGKVIKRTATLPERAIVSTKASLEEFMITARTTAKILSPSIARDASRFLESLKSALLRIPSTLFANARRRRTSPPTRGAILTSARDKVEQELSPLVRRGEGERAAPPGVIQRPPMRKPWSVRSWWERLPARTRRGGILLGLLALLLIIGIVVQGNRNVRDDEKNRAQVLLESIGEERDSYQAARIVQDESRSRELLASIARHIEAVQELTSPEQTQDLRQWLKAEQRTLWKITDVPHPTLLADLTLPQGSGSVDRLIFSGGSLYVEGNGTIRAVSPQDGKIQDITFTGEQPLVAPVQALTLESPTTLVYEHEGEGAFSIVEIDLKLKTVTRSPLTLPDATPDIVDLATYAGKIYLLDAKTGTIYRLAKDASGYHGTAWLAKGVTVDSPRALAIDGEVYVLKADRQIEKYLQGKKRDFSLGTVEPALEGPMRVVTAEVIANLYLVDAASHRVVVISKKDGTLVHQYQSDAWAHLADVAVSPDAKTLYVLDGTKIYTVALQE